MKHHWGDSLDRTGDYWTIVPNKERYGYGINNFTAGDERVTTATIGADDPCWENIFTFHNLEELTLHSPNTKQLEALARLTHLKRLRITHAKTSEITFLQPVTKVEELVLEYVSGFSDLSPLQALKNLKSLHIENLRRVSSFNGLAGLSTLRYLAIEGTLDWKQPIEDFEFLRGLSNLEYLSIWQFVCKAAFPALLPALSLQKLKRLRLVSNLLPAEEYALLEVGIPNVEGANWGPFHLSEYSPGEMWFLFTGKGAGRVRQGHSGAPQKCEEYAGRYEQMKAKARTILANPSETFRDGCCDSVTPL